LEYQRTGTSEWFDGFTLDSSQLDYQGNGTEHDWSVSNLHDSTYNIRMNLTCSSGIVYSQVATGIIDRIPPSLFGRPQPSNGNYLSGDIISFSYNENIGQADLSSKISIVNLANNQVIPFSVSAYNNQIVIVPGTSINNYTGDTIRVIASNVSDLYGNVKPGGDTLYFTVGNYIAATGPKALDLSISNNTVYANSNESINFTFRLAQPASHQTVVNYSIAGSAQFTADYDTSFASNASLLNTFNGSQGTIVIDSGQSSATLKIYPVISQTIGADKTIIISLNSSGDYDLGSFTSDTGTIVYSVLPVTLVSFTARVVNDKTNLQWQTANEVNTAYFAIERSTDGLHFLQLMKLNAKGNGGNLYAATDGSPAIGNNYYRLKMVDKDGKFVYSSIMLVNYTASGLHIVNVSPSPLTGSNGMVHIITDKASTLKLIVVDAVGRQMSVTTIAVQEGVNHIPLTFGNLTAGMYFLYAIDNNQRKSNTVRFVKQ
jgi:hypothetical protein